MQIAPKVTREEAELKTFEADPQWRTNELVFAYRNDAMRCGLNDVSSRSENGKVVFTLVLKPEKENYHPWEMTGHNLSADQVAEKRARLVLLGEEPKTGNASQDRQIRQGANNKEYDAGVITKFLRKAGGNITYANLQKARLLAICQLLRANIIEHVLEFSLGPVSKAGIPITFEGRRHKAAHNSPATVFSVSDQIPVSSVSP